MGRRLKQLILLLFITIFSFFCNIFQLLNSGQTIIYDRTAKLKNKTAPLILFYTPIFGQNAFKSEYVSSQLKTCSFSCNVSDNPNLYSQSNVAIFHSFDMKMDDFLQKHRNLNILHVFFTLEAFAHEKIRRKRFPKDFFNVTATHLRKSNLWMPYGKFQKIMKNETYDDTLVWNDKQVEEAISRKNKLAVIIASHCITHSFREKLIEDMERYTNISTFGKCYNSTTFNQTEELGKHFFYLAFENAVCKDYVTEKFWRIKDLIVPVVLKRSLLKGIVEDEYFIAADDFNSTKALVEKLENVSKNLTEYKKYFGWTKKYKKTASNDVSELCRLCEIAAKKEKHIIPDIYQWWEKESECQFNYLNFTLEYLIESKFTVNKDFIYLL